MGSLILSSRGLMVRLKVVSILKNSGEMISSFLGNKITLKLHLRTEHNNVKLRWNDEGFAFLVEFNLINSSFGASTTFMR